MIVETKIKMPAWSSVIFKKYRYLGIHGGRGSSKTWSVADALIILGSEEKLNIVCGREFQSSIDESVKTTLENSIHRQGLSDKYVILDTKIFGVNGTRFRFKGFARNPQSIKGLEDIDICWVEEAHTLSKKSLEILLPTIRKPGSRIIFTWNRNKTSDAVDKLFLGPDGPPEDSIVVKVNYYDNPFFTDELEAERLRCLKYQPERYPHIWEGEPDHGDNKYKVLPYAMLRDCVDAHIKLGIEVNGMRHSGLDPADAEDGDTNAYALRKSSLLESVDEWKVKYLHQTAARADFKNRSNGVIKMYYDAGGLGAGIKSDLSRLPKNPEDGSGPDPGRFIPVLFGGKVKGPDKVYTKNGKQKILNKDFFFRHNSQLWWNVRLRAENTIKALDKENVDIDKCFFISSKIYSLEKLLIELSQCVYDDSSGKLKVDKKPDGAESPNLADAVVLAFAADTKKGLKLK
jgi:phage terminase large subunit